MNTHPVYADETAPKDPNDTPTLAQTKVDPFQDPDYQPPLPGEPKVDAPQITPSPVGQEDSLTDQPRQGVSNEEQIAPARFEAEETNTAQQNTESDQDLQQKAPTSTSTQTVIHANQRQQQHGQTHIG